MIVDKRMKFIKSENDINYYLFKPSILSLYYNEKIKHKEYLVHLHTLSHKLHMLLYIVTNIRWGGYRVLYLENKGEILSYIAFTKANNRIIKNCEKNDYYTIFLWTYPEYRGKGLATKMSESMLNDLTLNYKNFYKTISKDNLSSIRVAEKCGFSIKSECIKSKFFHTIHQVDSGKQYLYVHSNNKDK